MTVRYISENITPAFSGGGSKLKRKYLYLLGGVNMVLSGYNKDSAVCCKQEIRDQNTDYFSRASGPINAIAVTPSDWIVDINSTVVPFGYVEET